MLRYIDSKKMGRGKHTWLDSIHHFSFAMYFNPDNMQFGVLRVVNDDLVKPGAGFDIHPHQDMEIISYVVNGELTHADSMDNKRVVARGDAQYMSAGTGVYHSEHNFGAEILRFLQIWILPDRECREPSYGDHHFKWEERVNKWLAIASGNKNSPAPIKIHADVNVFVSEITKGEELEFKVNKGRQAYLVLIEGSAQVGPHKLNAKDALEIAQEDILIRAQDDKAHVIIFEMKKS
ncbi:MAG: pirin family protein [Elusimicrobiota bacterium]|jgi:redox-sensitive bicupin YhaK (pirin superfamily)|nr:pirin family protein [Elusimicrobiota bacterium]